MSINVVLVDDHKILRDGLRSLLESRLGFKVVAEAETGRQALRAVQKHAPDVVIMDVSMPDMNGIDATRRIVESLSRVKVIALSMHSDRRFVSQMLGAGASGYLLKDCAFEELERAIHSVLRNQTYVSPAIAGVVVEDYLRKLDGRGAAAGSRLTQKEEEVLRLIAEGKSTKEIASSLNVSVKTIETHRQHIMAKLDIRSTAELTKYAIREGLTSLDG